MYAGPGIKNVDFKEELAAGRTCWHQKAYLQGSQHYWAALCEIEKQIVEKELGFPPQISAIKELYYRAWISWANCALQVSVNDEHKDILHKFYEQISVFGKSVNQTAPLVYDELFILSAIHLTMLLMKYKRFSPARETVMSLRVYLQDLISLSSSTKHLKLRSYQLECDNYLANIFIQENDIEQAVKVLSSFSGNDFALLIQSETSSEIQRLILMTKAVLLECYIRLEKVEEADVCFSEMKECIEKQQLPMNEKALLALMLYAKFNYEHKPKADALGVFNYLLSKINSVETALERPDLVCQTCLMGANIYLQPQLLNTQLAQIFLRLAEKYAVSLSEEDAQVMLMESLLMHLIISHHTRDKKEAEHTLSRLIESYQKMSMRRVQACQLLLHLLPLFPANTSSFFSTQIALLKLELEKLNAHDQMILYVEEFEKLTGALTSSTLSSEFGVLGVSEKPLLPAKSLKATKAERKESPPENTSTFLRQDNFRSSYH